MSDLPSTFPISITDLISAHPTVFNDVIRAVMSIHYGDTEPADSEARLWIHTTSKEFRVKGTDGVWRAFIPDINVVAGGLLAKTGGTMTGSIDAGGNTITNVGAGTGLSAARAQDLTTFVKIDGTRDFTARQKHPNTPSDGDHIANKTYVDTTAKQGGAFTGPVSVTSDPTDGNHLTRKHWVDNRVELHEDGTKVHKAAAMDSEAQLSDAYLISDGAGGAVFTQAGGYLDPSPVLLTESVDANWHSYDPQILGVPVGASWVMLEVHTTSAYFRFRPQYDSGVWQEYGGFGDQRIQVLVKTRSDGNFGAVYLAGGGVAEIKITGWL
jgi:hypothetical protein